LLNVIGLLDRPSSGRVWLENQDPSTLDAVALTELRGRMFGSVFQFHHVLPAFSARENVIMPAYAREGYPSSEMRERAAEVLRAVRLADKVDARVTQLSGEQQQRVAIARALVHGPALVLADQPAGNLDTKSADEVFELMRRWNRERGTTFLVVTHDPRVDARCSRVIEIIDGRVAGG
jgi:lipoprotein-releasing system ATP-binding protein